MKKVLILGATGMLGSAVYDFLKDKYELILSVRDKNKVDLLEKAYGGTLEHEVVEFDAAKVYEDFLNKKGYPGEYLTGFLDRVSDIDFAVNAIGITIPNSLKDPTLTLFINGALPRILAQRFGPKLIHVTTDCVYNGRQGFPYDENSPKTSVDLYGISKSLGEPENCITLRTSVIGRELEGFENLLEWFLRQDGKEVKGFSRHYWNGITARQFAKVCDQIMQNGDNLPKPGIYHIFSNPVSKYEMLLKFKEKFGIDCKINEDSGPELNRTLATVKELNERLRIPSFDGMLNDL